jgi:hypothetical protein
MSLSDQVAWPQGMQWGLDKKENWRGWSWICRNDSDRLPQHGRGGRLESVGWDLSLDVSGPNCLGSGDWDSVPWQSGLSHEDWRRRETETEAERKMDIRERDVPVEVVI